MEKTDKPAGKNREVIVLILVALIGAAGLLALQFARKTPSARSDERSMVQSGAQNPGETIANSSPIQKITGDLVTRDEEHPEVGRPFKFRMTNFAQGAQYELDLGDGSSRRTFQDGELEYVYQKSGEFHITLYAKFEGQEVKLRTITKEVDVHRKIQKSEMSDIIQD